MRVSLFFVAACAFMAGHQIAQGNLLTSLLLGVATAINFINLYRYCVAVDRQPREPGGSSVR